MQAQKGDFFYNSSIDNNFLSYLLFLSSAWIVNEEERYCLRRKACVIYDQ